MKYIIHAILLFLPIAALADKQKIADEWAKANSNCAGFYLAIQPLVKPEAQAEYLKKFVIHASFADALQNDDEVNRQQLNADISTQNTLLNRASTQNEKIEFFRKGLIGCNNIELHTPLVMKENGLQNSRQPTKP